MISDRTMQLAGLARLAGRLNPFLRGETARLPYKVEFYLTERCDSRCQTCDCWRRPSQTAMMTQERIFNAAQSMGSELLWVGLSGGEPTLRQDFIEIAQGIAQRCPRLVLLNFGTNGMNPERVLRQAEGVAGLALPFVIAALSIDGVGDVHDAARGVPGAFERAMESAEGLCALEKRHPRFRVSFQTTVSPLNAEGLLDLHHYLARRFPGHLHMATLAVESHLVGRELPEALRAGRKEIEALRRLGGVTPIKSPLDLIPRAYAGLLAGRTALAPSPIACVAGRDLVTVDAYGAVRACDYLKDPVARLAEFDDDLRALLLAPGPAATLAEARFCHACFTPCQAYPSLFRDPFHVALGLLASLRKA